MLLHLIIMLIQLKRLLRKIFLFTINRIDLWLLRHILRLQFHHAFCQFFQYILSLTDLIFQLGPFIKLCHFICTLAKSHYIQLILFYCLVNMVEFLHHPHFLFWRFIHVVLLEVFKFLFCFFCLADGFWNTEFGDFALLFQVFYHLFQDIRIIW